MNKSLVERIDFCFDDALIQYGRNEYFEVLKKAKEEYCYLIGDINDEDDDYDSRMAVFNDWYVLDFIIPGKNRTVIHDYIIKNLVEESIHGLLINVRFSLFEYHGKSMISGTMVLKDYLNEKKYYLFNDHRPLALVEGDLFLGRVIGETNAAYIRPGLGILPNNIKRIMKKEANHISKLNDPNAEKDFLLKIEAQKTKWRRYPHLQTHQVFTF